MEDNELPVFPFRINWREGITERYEWLTDVLADRLGNEQRRQIRLTPRRSFDVTLTLFNNERSFLDLWMNRMVDNETMFPVWHDATPMTASAAAGATDIAVDTRYLGFVEGGMAWVFGKDAFTGEAVEIVSVTDDGLEVSTGLLTARGRGTKVAPLIRGLIAPESLTGTRATTAAMENQVRFEVTRANPFDGGAEIGDSYLGLPVLTTKPDAKDDTDYTRVWTFDELDNNIGRRFRLSDQDRAMVGQRHSRLLVGRKAKADFKAFLYRRNGRQKPFWLPTYNEDFKLAVPAVAAGGFLDVERCGFAYTGGPASGREHIMIETKTGRHYHRIIDTAPATVGSRERLLVTPVIAANIAPADVRCISFIDTARLDTDQVEMAHVNAADGVSRCQLALKTFRNERTSPQPISTDIPIADMQPGACGTDYPEEGDPCNPLVAFDGWYIMVRIQIEMDGEQDRDFEFTSDDTSINYGIGFFFPGASQGPIWCDGTLQDMRLYSSVDPGVNADYHLIMQGRFPGNAFPNCIVTFVRWDEGLTGGTEIYNGLIGGNFPTVIDWTI